MKALSFLPLAHLHDVALDVMNEGPGESVEGVVSYQEYVVTTYLNDEDVLFKPEVIKELDFL